MEKGASVKLTYIVALAVVTLAAADNLITNGDFEQPLATGWVSDINGTAGAGVIERSDTLGQPSPGYAAYVYKMLAVHSSLNQEVAVQNTNLTLAFQGKFRLGGGSNTCWPACAVNVHYIDGGGSRLGCTRFLLRNEYCTWEESSTEHFYDVLVPGIWDEYRLDIGRELADNLPGINPADVAKIGVELYSYGNGT